MEDFSRLWIDVCPIAEQLKNGSLRLGLNWKNVSEGRPAIKLYGAVESDGGMKYLFDETVANLQKKTAPPSPYLAIRFNTGDFGGAPDSELVGTDEPVYFETSFWDDLPVDGIQHFLFEGAGEGKGELVFVLQSESPGPYFDVETTMSGVWFDLKDVKEMYQHFTVATPDNTFMGEEVMEPATTAIEINGVSTANLDEMGLEDDYILFVHGWRMKAWERRYFAETAFKRLFWQGYKGRFGMFSWPTEWTSRPWGTAITDTENYMRSDHKAMLSGQGLTGKMNELMAAYNGELSVFAHSMGNVVVSEALRQGGHAKTFVACQAASVARAYDASGPERLTSDRIYDTLSDKVGFIASWLDDVDSHPDVFANYPPTSSVYYSGISNNLIGSFINHHNRLDDALAWWLAGQAKKPNGDYYYDADDGYWYLNDAIWPVPDTKLFFPIDTFEIFSRVAEPDSGPLGTSVTNGFATAGEVSGNRNLQALHDFQDGDEDHSAQFRSTIQRRWDYWIGLMNDFGITP